MARVRREVAFGDDRLDRVAAVVRIGDGPQRRQVQRSPRGHQVLHEGHRVGRHHERHPQRVIDRVEDRVEQEQHGLDRVRRHRDARRDQPRDEVTERLQGGIRDLAEPLDVLLDGVPQRIEAQRSPSDQRWWGDASEVLGDAVPHARQDAREVARDIGRRGRIDLVLRGQRENKAVGAVRAGDIVGRGIAAHPRRVLLAGRVGLPHRVGDQLGPRPENRVVGSQKSGHLGPPSLNRPCSIRLQTCEIAASRIGSMPVDPMLHRSLMRA